MIDIEFICQRCGKKSPEEDLSMLCRCGGHLRGVGLPSVSGTRDSFGISRAFKGDDGKTIDNWRTWEKAGYRNPLDTVKDHNVREKIKDKISKIKHKKQRGEYDG